MPIKPQTTGKHTWDTPFRGQGILSIPSDEWQTILYDIFNDIDLDLKDYEDRLALLEAEIGNFNLQAWITATQYTSLTPILEVDTATPGVTKIGHKVWDGIAVTAPCGFQQGAGIVSKMSDLQYENPTIFHKILNYIEYGGSYPEFESLISFVSSGWARIGVNNFHGIHLENLAMLTGGGSSEVGGAYIRQSVDNSDTGYTPVFGTYTFVNSGISSRRYINHIIEGLGGQGGTGIFFTQPSGATASHIHIMNGSAVNPFKITTAPGIWNASPTGTTGPGRVNTATTSATIASRLLNIDGYSLETIIQTVSGAGSGVTGLRSGASPYLTGQATLLAGTNITFNQVGQNITINSTGGGGGGAFSTLSDVEVPCTGSAPEFPAHSLTQFDAALYDPAAGKWKNSALVKKLIDIIGYNSNLQGQTLAQQVTAIQAHPTPPVLFHAYYAP